MHQVSRLNSTGEGQNVSTARRLIGLTIFILALTETLGVLWPTDNVKAAQQSLRTLDAMNERILLSAAESGVSPQDQQLSFSFVDPVGDQAGRIDVTRMVVVFDSTTGDYSIILTASSANPFIGMFRVNINLRESV